MTEKILTMTARCSKKPLIAVLTKPPAVVEAIHDPLIAVDMSGAWNPLSALDNLRSPLCTQKSFSDTDLVAADMTSYNDPVRDITSPTMKGSVATLTAHCKANAPKAKKIQRSDSVHST
ncbi:hypothetical protein PoB_004369800 [Plakobranchus ocellatus]|uniref:Uncharacterized protein n=1 Tax=Plakobranchus ocellatus TaxID=259542 RepID=A0AAV4BDD0_9GAST|nr:hypothetical protein PoB_004369800 [Plakobranchus ocellatus]